MPFAYGLHTPTISRRAASRLVGLKSPEMTISSKLRLQGLKKSKGEKRLLSLLRRCNFPFSFVMAGPESSQLFFTIRLAFRSVHSPQNEEQPNRRKHS